MMMTILMIMIVLVFDYCKMFIWSRPGQQTYSQGWTLTAWGDLRPSDRKYDNDNNHDIIISMLISIIIIIIVIIMSVILFIMIIVIMMIMIITIIIYQ